MEAITRRRAGKPKLPGSLKSIRLRESVCKKLWDPQNAQTVILQCKMRLTVRSLDLFCSFTRLYEEHFVLSYKDEF